MTMVIRCRDVGVDCDFVARGQTEQEILQQCAEHARSAHGINELSPELAQQLRSGIREDGKNIANLDRLKASRQLWRSAILDPSERYLRLDCNSIGLVPTGFSRLAEILLLNFSSVPAPKLTWRMFLVQEFL